MIKGITILTLKLAECNLFLDFTYNSINKEIMKETIKVFIKDLKKGQAFKFNNTVYTVRQKHADWKKNDEPYLKTMCGKIFEFDELEVELCRGPQLVPSINGSNPKLNHFLDGSDESYVHFSTWVQDNYSQNISVGVNLPLPKGQMRLDFTDSVFTMEQILKEYKSRFLNS